MLSDVGAALDPSLLPGSARRGHPSRRAAARARRRRHRQDARDRGAVPLARGARVPARADRGADAVGGPRRRAARAARGRARARLRASCSSSDRVELAGAAARARRGRRRSTRCSGRATGWRCCSSGSTSCRSQHHDFGGSANALLGGFVRRIDRLKAELIGAEDYAAWAERGVVGAGRRAALEREFAEIYRTHERMLAEAGARDAGDLVLRRAAAAPRERRGGGRGFEHLLIDDAQELDLAPAQLALAVGGAGSDGGRRPDAGAAALPRRRRGARSRQFETREPRGREARAEPPLPLRERVVAARRRAVLGGGCGRPRGEPGGEVAFWRCANDRAQAQSVAADIERLIAREGVDAGRIAVLVPAIAREGQAVAVALEERAVPHRLVGEAAFFQRAEIRDVLAWLRLLADPSDAAAVVRALARPPIELRSVDIARCTQIARRRKLDMVAALAAATESPQVPPEARERIRVFLKLYRAGIGGDRHDAARPLRAPADRAARAAPPAAVRRAGRRRRAAAGAGAVRRAGFGLRAPRAAGDAAGVRALDRRRGRLRAARAGGARAVGCCRVRPGADAPGRRRARGRARLRARAARGAGGAGVRARSPTRCCARSCRPTTRRRGGSRCARRCTWR